MVGELVRFQLRKRGLKEDSHEIKQLYRLARPADLDKFNEVKGLEFATMHGSRKLAITLGLKMKISDVEYQGDGKKATFFYTADDRVDFRELIKRLADEFKVRIEMRQIGMRQEAARLGGIGSCGRELCCSTWLTDFKIVSTSAARYQNLSLNPLKLAGQCGKLKCCLNYELDTYMDAVRDIPESNVRLQTGKGTMVHRKTDIFKRIMWYALLPEQKPGEERSFAGAEQWIPMSVDRVKEIIAMNKAGQRPEEAGALDLEEEEDLGYDDVVGQDSLTRMDRKKKKKKKKPGNRKEGAPQGGDAQKRSAASTGQTASAGGQEKKGNANQGNRSGQARTGGPSKQSAPPQQGKQGEKTSAAPSPAQKNQAPRPQQGQGGSSSGNRPPRQAPGGQSGPAPAPGGGNRPPRKAPGSDNT
jgi:cell fate regulator YaaT (PSP1 superfamily)